MGVLGLEISRQIEIKRARRGCGVPQRAPPRDYEGEARHAVQAFIGRGGRGRDIPALKLDPLGPEAADAIQEQRDIAMSGTEPGDALNIIQAPGRGLVLDYGDPRDSPTRKLGLQPLQPERLAPFVPEHNMIDMMNFRDPREALAINAVGQDQEPPRGRRQAGQHGLQRGRAGTRE